MYLETNVKVTKNKSKSQEEEETSSREILQISVAS